MTTASLQLPAEGNHSKVVYDPNALPEEAFDPANEVCKSLMFAGHKDPFRWMTGIDPNAVNPNIDVDLRRFLVNRHLRMVLGVCDDIDTNAERYCLVDKGSNDEWSMLIRESVAPCIAKNDLPHAPVASSPMAELPTETPSA
jgi:hypothetical protein